MASLQASHLSSATFTTSEPAFSADAIGASVIAAAVAIAAAVIAAATAADTVAAITAAIAAAHATEFAICSFVHGFLGSPCGVVRRRVSLYVLEARPRSSSHRGRASSYAAICGRAAMHGPKCWLLTRRNAAGRRG